MWIDSDLEFPDDLILKLIEVNKPLTAASYAKKRWNMDGITSKVEGFKRIAGREPNSIEEFGPLLVNSNLNLPEGANHAIVNGFVDVKDAATGLMLVRHDCLRLIVDKFGDDLMYKNDVSVAGSGIGGCPCPRGQQMYDFYGLMIDADKRLLSEDYCFCRRYSLSGGESIPMLVSCTTVHHGRSSYRANPLMRWASEGAFAQKKTEENTERA